MDCRRTRRRLVAYLDDELAPGDVARIEDHLERCQACADHRDALVASTPVAPRIALDDGELHAVQLKILSALDEVPLPKARATRDAPSLREMLTGDIRLPRSLVVLYAAALLGVIGWATSGSLMTAPDSKVAAEETDPPVRTALEMHQPAAYTPSDGWF